MVCTCVCSIVSPSVTIPGRPTSKMLSSTGTTTLQGNFLFNSIFNNIIGSYRV